MRDNFPRAHFNSNNFALKHLTYSHMVADGGVFYNTGADVILNDNYAIVVFRGEYTCHDAYIQNLILNLMSTHLLILSKMYVRLMFFFVYNFNAIICDRY